jgi:hypothetical protein
MKIQVVYVLAIIAPALALAETYVEEPQCGTEGSVMERIADCSQKYPNDSQKLTEDDESQSDLPVSWRLITVVKDAAFSKVYRQVWYSESTNLVWSDRLVFDKHGGYISHQHASTICQDPSIGPASKGNLNLEFRLPAIDEFKKAQSQNLKDVLPGISDSVFSFTGSEIADGRGTTALHHGYAFWASDTETDERGRTYAWVYDAYPFPLLGSYFHRTNITKRKYVPGKHVMCVAELQPWQ